MLQTVFLLFKAYMEAIFMALYVLPSLEKEEVTAITGVSFVLMLISILLLMVIFSLQPDTIQREHYYKGIQTLHLIIP